MGELVGGFVIFGQQRPQPFQPTGDDLEHGGGGIRRQFLRQRGDAQPWAAARFRRLSGSAISPVSSRSSVVLPVPLRPIRQTRLAGIELEAGAVQQLFSAEGDREVDQCLIGFMRHAHGEIREIAATVG
jgi:hypothetical protein